MSKFIKSFTVEHSAWLILSPITLNPFKYHHPVLADLRMDCGSHHVEQIEIYDGLGMSPKRLQPARASMQ